MLAVLYVTAVGFVMAGLMNAVHLAVVPARGDGREGQAVILHFDTFADRAWSLLVCTLAGPFLLVRYGLRFWLQGAVPVSAFAASLAIGAMWSFLSGVVFVELAVFLGLLPL